GNPFVESFTYPGNKGRILVALFGLAAGLTVIFYTAMFTGMGFLKSTMHMDDTAAEMIAGVAALVGIAFFVGAGHLSDRIGRKSPIVIGYALTLLLLFPAFWTMGASGERAGGSAAWTIAGPDCRYDAFAKVQASECGKLMGDFTGAGIAYTLADAPTLALSRGGTALDTAAL